MRGSKYQIVIELGRLVPQLFISEKATLKENWRRKSSPVSPSSRLPQLN